MKKSAEWLKIGTLVAAQGLRGELRVNPSTDFPERFTKPGIRWLQSNAEQPREIKLLAGRQLPGKSIYIIKIAGINDRDSAQSLIGKELLVPSVFRPKLGKNEFHFLDLLNLKVKLDPKSPSIGKVIGLQTAGNDLLEIELLEGKKVLIPFVTEIVPVVAIEEGWIHITPPPGLLDI